MSDWKKSISQTVGSERLTDISQFVKHEQPNSVSPLDHFYTETRKVMSVALPTNLDNSDWLGSLYLIYIVSTTENYFREILGKIIKICPVSQKNSTSCRHPSYPS